MKNSALVLLIVLGMAPLARADDGVSTAPLPAIDQWVAWSDNFDSTISACVKAGEKSCLSKAFMSRPRPVLEGNPPYVTDTLYYDLRTAEVLIHQPDASKLLSSQYGIDASAYLGTGFSVPLQGAGALQYQFARQQEYFVPNLCAEAVDKTVCPARDPNMWAWHLTSAQMQHWLDAPIAALLHQRPPRSDAAAFGKLAAPKPVAPGELPSLLIRFGNFPLKYYSGAIGRPGAVRVFFASYQQVRGETLRGAVVATGAASLIAKPDPANTFFIWLYAPHAGTKAAVASWKELFGILSAAGPN